MTNRIDTRLAKAAAAGRPALAPFLTIGFPDVQTSTRIAGACWTRAPTCWSWACRSATRWRRGRRYSGPASTRSARASRSTRAWTQPGTSGGTMTTRACSSWATTTPFSSMDSPGRSRRGCRRGVRRLHRPRPARRGVRPVRRSVPPAWAAPHPAPCSDEHGRAHSFSLRTGRRLHILRQRDRRDGSARANVHGGVRGLVERIRRHTDLPILVGFGISKPEHVSEVAQFSEGALVGSALIETIESASGDPAVAAAEFAASLRGKDM